MIRGKLFKTKHTIFLYNCNTFLSENALTVHEEETRETDPAALQLITTTTLVSSRFKLVIENLALVCVIYSITKINTINTLLKSK